MSIAALLPTPARRALRAVAGVVALAAPASLAGAQSGGTASGGTYTFLGDVRGYERVPGGVLLRAGRGRVLVEAVAGVGARVRVRFDDGRPGSGSAFAVPHSLAAGDTAPPLGAATVREAGDTVVVAAAGVEVRATRRPLRVSVRDDAGRTLLDESFGPATFNGRLVHYARDLPGTRYYGLGEYALPNLARNGGVYPFWNTDRPTVAGDPTIYTSLPFYVGVRGGAAYGILYDNPFQGEMDLANRLPGSIGYAAEGGPDGGELRYYVVPGPGLDSVAARFSRLTGRHPLPPRWALGYQQSRYSYSPDTQVANLAAEFRRRDVPADVIHLDIDYMDGYRVFTWHPTRFPRPKALLDSLARQGFKVVTIVDPGVKQDTTYRVFREGLALRAFATNPDGSLALGRVWPDTSAFPDYSRAAVRDWWGRSQAALLDVGVRGIWNDMNEPASFFGRTLSELVEFGEDGQRGTHLEYHNQYGTLMARASYEGQRRLRPERRPFTIVRAGYTGMQRYTAIWTGDNRAEWAHLRVVIPQIVSLGLSGQPFAGSDVGGFMGAASAELYARWMQAAVLHPFYRTHTEINSPRREPWSFGPDDTRANRATLRLRYRLLPALYTAFDQHARTGAPTVRPLFWSAPGDTTALAVDDAYLFGDHLLAAPVVDSAVDARAVYLPAGRWYRMGSDSAYDGGRRVTVSAPRVARDGGDTTGLRGLPLFARAGAVIPMQAPLPYADARRPDTLVLHVFPPADPAVVTSELYEDAGDGYGHERGELRRTTFTVSAAAGGRLVLAAARAGRYAGARTFAVTVHAVDRPGVVTADGRAVPVRYDEARREASFAVPANVGRLEIGR
jgi:alpha-glucosidase